MSLGHLIKNEIARQEREKEEANGMTFEDALEKLIDDYGAPEHIAEEIKDFLIQSCNVYSIIELAKKHKEVN
jgi:hypothetical protein